MTTSNHKSEPHGPRSEVLSRMKDSKIRLSVAARVSGSIFLSILVITGFMVIYFPQQQIKMAREQAQQTAQLVAEVLAYQAAIGIDFADTQTIEGALNAAERDHDFLFGVVYGVSEDGKMKELAKKQAKDFTEAATAFESKIDTSHIEGAKVTLRDDGLEVVTPITTPMGKKALLVMGYSTRSMESRKADVQRTSIVAALISLLVGVLVSYVSGSSLGRRVSRVASTAQRVAAGDLSQELITDDHADEIGQMVRYFNELLMGLRSLQQSVIQVSNGDLSSLTDANGDLPKAFNEMIMSQRTLVREMAASAVQLNSAAGEFLANAQQQQEGAVEQSTAVEETRRTTETLLSSARQINESADGVLRNAELTQQNHQVVAQRIADLSSQTQRISEILEVIKDIANKSDLLALNAALEGTKAGEAGKGFSFVAQQMQRLAENVMNSVRDIKELTQVISQYSQASVLATEESTKLASDTTRSARQISLILQQQQSGTEQVTRAMDDVSKVASQTAAGSREIVSSAQALIALSEQLQKLINRFKLDDENIRAFTPPESTPRWMA